MITLKYALAILFVLGATTLQAAPLTLTETLDLARQNNPSLKGAAYDETIASQVVGEARSGYRPRVDLEGGYTVLKDPQAFTIGGGVQPTQDSSFPHLSVGVKQTLYDFGRTSGRVDGAKATAEATRERYRALEQDVFLRTVSAYYRILAVQRLLQAADMEVAQMSEHLDRAKALYEEGVVTRNDVLQAEVRLAGSRQLHLGRANALENAWLTLNYLTGRAAEARGELQEEPVMEAPAVQDAAQAVADRGELKAQQQLIRSHEEALRQSRSAYYPELFASAGMDYVKNSYVKEQTMFAATLGIRMNLFDGLASTARVQEAAQVVAQSRQQLEDLQGQARLEYLTALNDAKVASERIAVAREAIRQGEENLRINQNRYREQVGTATEVIDAQTLLTQTRTEYDQALFDYQVAIARVKKATGTL